MEHRWGQRLNVAIPIRLCSSSDRRETAAQLANLSLSGAWIPIQLDVRPLAIIQVIFQRPGLPEDSPDTVEACVARQSHDGIGLEWCEYAPQVVVRLLQSAAQRHHALHPRDAWGVDARSAGPPAWE